VEEWNKGEIEKQDLIFLFHAWEAELSIVATLRSSIVPLFDFCLLSFLTPILKKNLGRKNYICANANRPYF
jgi:hypothetical protein